MAHEENSELRWRIFDSRSSLLFHFNYVDQEPYSEYGIGRIQRVVEYGSN